MATRKGAAAVRDGMSTPSPGEFPALEAVAPKYDRLLELAEENLDGPISARFRCWEDGEVEIRVYHAHGYADSDVRHKTVLRYHSRTGDVVGAVKEVSGDSEALLHRETITNIGSLGDEARRKNCNSS